VNDNLNIFGTICKLLNENSPVVLASIISRQGSAPRSIGAKIVISANVNIYGTIGGGLMESKIINEASAVLDSGKSRRICFDLDNKNVNASGMICGGKVTVMLEYLKPTQLNIKFFHKLYDTVTKGDSCTLITLFEDDASEISHCLIFPDGEIATQYPLSTKELELLRMGAHNIQKATSISLETHRGLLEPLCVMKTLCCFGAGHIAVPTARIAALAGFRVIVLDDRTEFANVERFPDAMIRVVDGFNHAFDELDIDINSYIVIATHEHQYDCIVLEKSLKTKAGYIGMIASRTKRDVIYRVLSANGIDEQDLARIHSPIGLDIGAETPEEIAVSIVAELIKERSSQRI
jgi:xanthine dehydrogenase accessory factor